MPETPDRPQGETFSDIRFRGGEVPGARYVSGRTVFDEALSEGRLVARYWNAAGQVWPETQYRRRRWSADRPADTFRLGIDGRDLAGGFAWESARVEQDASRYRARRGADGIEIPVSHGVIELAHEQAGVRVRVHTRLDGGPFVIRWLEIVNMTDEPKGITAVSPFAGVLWSHRYDEHVPPGYESPFELVWNHEHQFLKEGDFWPEPLPDGRKLVDGGKMGRSGYGRPAFWARDLANGQTFVCELAWGGNYEFELDCRLRAEGEGHDVRPPRRWGELCFRMGLSGVHPVLRVLGSGETLATPAVHLALFQEGTDAIVQATHDHVRRVVLPEPVPGRYVEIEANHRGYLCDHETTPDIKRDIDVAAAVGAEMYVVDAGWYGNEPNAWGANVGDWFEGEWMMEGGGLKAVADHAHARGMRFGLWAEVEASGDNSALRKEHPDWSMTCRGSPVAGGRALDLTKPEVAAFVESEIERLILQYDLDMYRLDHNHCLQPAGNRLHLGFDEDLIWRYYETLYAIFDRLRAKFPGVAFQNCAGGGGRLDWGTLSRFHNTELSDWARLPRGVKILNGVTMSLPPEILLRTFGTEVGDHVLDGDVDTQLRQCLCRIIFRGIAPSLEELSPFLRERIERYLEAYREVIRPVMEDGLVFHHTPFTSMSDHSPWCVLEYASRDRSRGVAGVFKLTCEGNGYAFRPRGLDLSCDYQVTLDSARQTFRTGGRELAETGVGLKLECALTSELVIYQGT